jgi:hypothetical protein
MLSKREIVSFWAGYIVMMRNQNENMSMAGKYNNVVMEELISDLCKMYNVDKSIIDDMDYEYEKSVPLKLILKKMKTV